MSTLKKRTPMLLLLKKIAENNILLEIVDGKLKLSSEGGKIDENLLNEIRSNKEELTTYLINAQSSISDTQESKPIENAPALDSYPLSRSQYRLWVLGQFEGGSEVYNMPFSTTVQLTDIENFKNSLNAVIDRHEILRTVFKKDSEGNVRQWIKDRTALDFQFRQENYRNHDNTEAAVRSYIALDTNRPFDLENGPLLRFSLLEVAQDTYVFYYNMHHIISDGWSLDILARDVLTFYNAYNHNRTAQLPDLRIQYKDYSVWQSHLMESDLYQKHKDYWLNSLSGTLPVLDLPSNKVRPKVFNHQAGHNLSTVISPEKTAALKQYCNGAQGSLFMGLLSLWTVMFHKYTHLKDIIIGTPVSGREHIDLNDQIGMYVNTLVLRNKVDPTNSFSDLFKEVKTQTLAGYGHQVCPFDEIVESMSLTNDESRNLLFDVMLSLQNVAYEDHKAGNLDQDIITDEGHGLSKFDLNLAFQDHGSYLSLDVNYNAEIYESQMIKRMIRHFNQLLTNVIANPNEKVSALNYITVAETNEILEDFNNTTITYPTDKTIVGLFNQQVVENPNRTAVIFEGKELSYETIDEISNQLARYLVAEKNVGSDDLVAIHLPQNEWPIIAILGILKTGAAYVPIDVEYPKEKIEFIKKDCQCKVTIDSDEITQFISKKEAYSSQYFPTEITPDHLAYVIYTSGSTGKPKGVLVPHKTLVNYNYWFTKAHHISKTDSSLVTSSLAFDGIMTCVYGCILNGGAIHLLKKEVQTDPVAVINYIKTHHITFLKGTPVYLRMLFDTESAADILDGKTLRLVITGGDKADITYVERIVTQSEVSVINHYGPTESTVGVSTYSVNQENLAAFKKHLSIGSPIDNVQLYILDDQLQLCSKGVVGEICISGSGLANGYLNDPKLTSDKFVSNPFREGERLYRTGDLGKWLEDGTISFMGRKDDQVKVRGHRIELGEIEYFLSRHDKIEESVVKVIQRETSQKELAAYIVSRKKLLIADLRAYLSNHLPAYKLPSYYVQMERMPLTTNSKIDRAALPYPTDNDLSIGVDYIAPRNDIEKKLVVIWSEILKMESNTISVKNNFMDLGGHSLKIIRVIARIQKEFGLKINVQKFFDNAVLEKIAEDISNFIWNHSGENEELESFKI